MNDGLQLMCFIPNIDPEIVNVLFSCDKQVFLVLK